MIKRFENEPFFLLFLYEKCYIEHCDYVKWISAAGISGILRLTVSLILLSAMVEQSKNEFLEKKSE